MTGLRDSFQSQARGCAKLGSPFMERLMMLFADRLEPGTPVADKMFDWPGDTRPQADNVPLRIAAGLHAIRRDGRAGLARVYPPCTVSDDALWSAVFDAMMSEGEYLLHWLDRPPQTNEVRRSAALIPVLHLLTNRFRCPIRLTEIGAAAGLNLVADRFVLDAGGVSFGSSEAPVRLNPDWSGSPPEPTNPHIVSRTGVDLSPIDPGKEADRIIAYLWPDQQDRIARTEAAIVLARAIRPRMVQDDAVEWLSGRGLDPVTGTTHLLFHTIAWQYLSEDAQVAGDALIAAAGARATRDAPLARFSMEADGDAAALRLQLWPSGGTVDLGRADYHGRWIEWRCPELPEVLE